MIPVSVWWMVGLLAMVVVAGFAVLIFLAIRESKQKRSIRLEADVRRCTMEEERRGLTVVKANQEAVKKPTEVLPVKESASMDKYYFSYRNNGLWSQLTEELLIAATKLAEEAGMSLEVKIFAAETTFDEIVEWAKSTMPSATEGECMFDNTVKKAFRVANGGSFYSQSLDVLRSGVKLKSSVDDTYKAVFARVQELVQPTKWVVVSYSITDYHPLDGEQTEESYVKRFKDFIPAGSDIVVCQKAKDSSQRGLSDEFKSLGLDQSKVVVVCHHHAAPMCDYRVMQEALGEGSLIIESAMEDILPKLVGMIEISDLIDKDAIEQIREAITNLDF